MVAGKRVEREVRCSQRRWSIDNINTSRISREICLAVRAKAPYGLTVPAARVSVPAGGTLASTVRCARLWADFKGKVQLNGLNLPPGFGFASTEIPPDKNEAAVKITVAANVPPGIYTVNLRGDAQVPFRRDTATPPSLIRVADPATPLTVEVTMPAKK
jgi:hypothetical protein